MANHQHLPKIEMQRQSSHSGNPAALLESHQPLQRPQAHDGSLPALLSKAMSLCLRHPNTLAPHGDFLLDAAREMGGGRRGLLSLPAKP